MGFGRYNLTFAAWPHGSFCVSIDSSNQDAKQERRWSRLILKVSKAGRRSVKKSGLGYQRPRLPLKTGAFHPGSSWLPYPMILGRVPSPQLSLIRYTSQNMCSGRNCSQSINSGEPRYVLLWNTQKRVIPNQRMKKKLQSLSQWCADTTTLGEITSALDSTCLFQ